MTIKVKEFLYDIKKLDEYKYFMYYKLYLNPSSIFNDEIDCEIIEKYISDKNFIDFINCIYHDDEFCAKLSYDTINFIHKILMETVDNYSDNTKINSLIRDTEIMLRISYRKTIGLTNKREHIYKLIENDDYDGTDFYLNRYVYTPDDIVNALTCNNDFLDLIENKIMKGNLDKIVIDNIINILYRSIELKMYIHNKKDYQNYKIPVEEIKNFDVSKAKNIIKELNKIRRRTKITYFNKYIVKNM